VTGGRKLWRLSTWRRLLEGLGEGLYQLTHEGDLSYDRWNLGDALAWRYLRLSKEFTLNPAGTPNDLAEGENGHERWKELLGKIRLGFFYSALLDGRLQLDELVDEPEDRAHVLRWARKRYPFISDLLTAEVLEELCPDSKLAWELNLNLLPTRENPMIKELEFSYRNKKTGQVVRRDEATKEMCFSTFDLYPKYGPIIDEAHRLIGEHWDSLWD
jgi:hypothetical protein